MIDFANEYSIDLTRPTSIAIDLDFDGGQPKHFGASPATATPMIAGEFVGNTRQGFSCNADIVTINIHCNGTHTETVSHIVDNQVNISSAAMQGFYVACLVSVVPVVASECAESYDPCMEPQDLVIGRRELETALGSFRNRNQDSDALIIRTLPNPIEKKSYSYGDPIFAPYLSQEAMDWILDLGVNHLLVDFPSVDRSNDDGRLSNHHRYWNVEQGSRKLSDASRVDKTITEMIFVPDSIADGYFALNLQVAPFCNNASPSRPILYPLTRIENG
ncbi:MAG: cyclase family protein [Planctomycetota bacterium]